MSFSNEFMSSEDATHARRRNTATSVKMVAKVKKHVKPTQDIRGSTRQIASIVGISLKAAHTILKQDLKMKKIDGFPIY
jgi:hypothetical protein